MRQRLGAVEGHSLFLCRRGQPRSLRMPLFKKGCQRWRFCSVAHSDVNLWQRVCLYVHVCLCCLTSRSTPHLPTTTTTATYHLLTEWQPTLAHWNSKHTVFCPACWGSHQSPHPTPQDSWPTGLSRCYETPVIFFPLRAPPSPSSPTQRVRSSTVASLNYSSVYISCQEKKKRTWSKDTGWMWCGNKFPTYAQIICDFWQDKRRRTARPGHTIQ